MKDLISIIVPVYNVEKFLPRCIDSLIAQTYSNIEIILVDDGSTDSSGTICDKYAAKFNNVKAVHTVNMGLSAARNEGVRNSSGAFIGFIDSDDWAEIDMFQILYNILQENGADFSACGLIDEYGTETDLKRNDNLISYTANQEETFKQILKNNMFYGYAWNKLFKKEILGNLTFDEKLLSCEDIDFTVRYAAKTKKSAFTSEKLYHYRHHALSMTGDFSYNPRKLSVLDAYENIMPFYSEFCNSYLSAIHTNYLKIAINIKGRMLLSKVSDGEVCARLDDIVNKYYPVVIKTKSIPLASKINIFISHRFPGDRKSVV